MFRLKVALTLVILLAVQAIFTFVALDSQIAPTVVDDTETALQRSATLLEKTHRLDQFSLAEKARFVASRPTIRRAMVAHYEGDAEYNRHVELHKQLETEQLRFEQQGRRRSELRNLDIDLLHRRPVDQELFMVLDETGRGVATLGRDLAHWMGDNVARDFPIILEAMEKNETALDVWSWTFHAHEDGQLHTVAIAPIRHPERDESVGVIILGNLMNDGFAHRDQSLVAAGVDTETVESLSPRAELHVPHVAFFSGSRIHSSTLRTREIQQLQASLFEEHQIQESSAEIVDKFLELSINEESHIALVRFFSGHGSGDDPAGIILLVNRDDALAPVLRAQSNILFLTLFLLVLGLILFFTFFHLFLQPFQKIEDGVQTIISGDKDHVFEVSDGNEVANGLAHHLNLMSAYLQGKPMPDDDVGSGGWDGFDPADSPDQNGADESKKPALAGVPMDLGLKKKKKASSDEDQHEEEKV